MFVVKGVNSHEDRGVAALSAQVVRHGHQEAAEHGKQHGDVMRFPGLLRNTENHSVVMILLFNIFFFSQLQFIFDAFQRIPELKRRERRRDLNVTSQKDDLSLRCVIDSAEHTKRLRLFSMLKWPFSQQNKQEDPLL